MEPNQIYHPDPNIMGGAFVFTGTRVPVDCLIAHLKAGDSLEQFLDGGSRASVASKPSGSSSIHVHRRLRPHPSSTYPDSDLAGHR